MAIILLRASSIRTKNMKNNKYTVVIIDVNTLCTDTLRRSLAEYTELLIVGNAQTSLKGKKMILEQHPDLLFLDVDLPCQNGLELLKEINQEITWPMRVIFYTAFEKYLLDALRISAFDYLMKPFEQAEIKLVIKRFLNQALKEQNLSANNFPVTPLSRTEQTYLIATITGYQKLRTDQIGYFEYQKEKKQWTVVLNDHSRLQLKHNTKAEDITNYSSTFIQINQGHIINFDYLWNIDDKTCQLLPPFHKANPLFITRTFFKELQEKCRII